MLFSTTNVRIVEVWLLVESLLFLTTSVICARSRSDSQSHSSADRSYEYGVDEQTRYVNIVTNGMRDALNHVNPRDASEYQVDASECRRHPMHCWRRLDSGTYDFIVIGSGASGSVIANRLTEVENFNVLLLEAGHFENEFADIPGMSFFTQGTKYNWGYTSVPQRNCCLGMENQECRFARGRGFGGSTIINAQVYSRGSASDYNRWHAQGNPGWSYEDVLPYFRKSEDHHIVADQGYHGTGGEYNVEYTTYSSPHIEAFLAANSELGYQIIDYNGRDHLGASRTQSNTKQGHRQTTGAAFIVPIVNRRNLAISADSYVTKILINPITKVAYGVEFVRDHLPYVAYANREVILAAGSIGSPQILMHSGIGPRSHLTSVGIPVLLDLPVGNNLQDHICLFGLSITTNTSTEILSLEENVREYLKGEGIFTLAGNHGGLGFYKTSFSKYDSADLEFILITPNRTDGYFQKGFGFTDETAHALTANLDNPKTFSVYIYTLHPDSVGTVRLKSNDPFAFPLIDPRFFEDPDQYDIETMYYGVQLIEKMLETPAMRKLDARFKPSVLPACKQHQLFSKAYWVCFMQQTSDEIYHPVGTCKMGPDPRRGAVVNSRLQVHGIHNLRVADASVIPFSMVGHTCAPSIMIGERLGDFIKEFYNVTTNEQAL